MALLAYSALVESVVAAAALVNIRLATESNATKVP